MSTESLRYLLGRARLVENRIRSLVAHRRQHDPAPDDPFRGLYLSEAVVEYLLADVPVPPRPDSGSRDALEQTGDTDEAAGRRIRLRDLARSADLSEQDIELLVICLLPDLDPRFERLYGFLNDDVSRRRATVALALELADLSPVSAASRARLAPGAPLVDNLLVMVEDTDRPFLTRGLRVPDRVTAHLVGDDVADPALKELLTDTSSFETTQVRDIATALIRGQSLIYLRESVGGAGAAMAVAAFESSGRPAISADATRLTERADTREIATILGREALLCGAGVVVSPIDALVGTPAAIKAVGAIREFERLPVPVVLTGTCPWDPSWTVSAPLLIDAVRLTPHERIALWERELRRATGGVNPLDVAAQFVLSPHQVSRAVESAAASAATTDGVMTPERLRRGARSQNASGLERMSRRIEPGVSWTDIVLPESTLEQLHELTSRARHRDLVLREWHMRPGGGRGNGVTGLFAGESGTGKTMAAEVIAGDLGLDLYTVNLSSVVDKYVGETEKNLERIFSEASGVNAVLLFDEADAIFGKRSEVRDAHDRYANIESAYLLQRVESFDGIAILTSNLRANIDDAFTRRLDVVVDFPAPDVAARLALWTHCLAPPLPCAANIDLDFCARSFTLSGGNIRSAAITASYRAADAGRPVSMVDIVEAVRQEYRKLGRLVAEREFGAYFARPDTRSSLGEQAADIPEHSPGQNQNGAVHRASSSDLRCHEDEIADHRQRQ